MEMCYDRAIVMPSSYTIMNGEEMMYVEGGIKASVKWWGRLNLVGVKQKV